MRQVKTWMLKTHQNLNSTMDYLVNLNTLPGRTWQEFKSTRIRGELDADEDCGARLIEDEIPTKTMKMARVRNS
jgi:hypothetical protein